MVIAINLNMTHEKRLSNEAFFYITKGKNLLRNRFYFMTVKSKRKNNYKTQ